MSGISHGSISVNDLQRAKAFYNLLMPIVGSRVRFVFHRDGNKIEAGLVSTS